MIGIYLKEKEREHVMQPKCLFNIIDLSKLREQIKVLALSMHDL